MRGHRARWFTGWLASALAITASGCPPAPEEPDAGPAAPRDGCFSIPDPCDGIDQDCDGVIDEDAICALTTAEGGCVDGRCVIVACTPPLADCNGDPADGCEVAFPSDLACGTCDATCGDGTHCAGEERCVPAVDALAVGLSAWQARLDARLIELSVDGTDTAVAVEDQRPIASVTAAEGHRCMLDYVGQVWCWGMSRDGALGLGTTTSAERPTQVALPRRAASIDTNRDLACAVLVDGSLFCWGSDSFGRLRHPSDGTVPGRIAGLAPVAQVAVGRNHLCARLEDDGVRCWGWDPVRGDPDAPLGGIATPVGLPPVSEIAAGHGWTCAISRDDEMWCWGHEEAGVRVPIPSPTPFQVDAPPRLRGLAMWSHLACVLADDDPHCLGLPADPADWAAGRFERVLGVEGVSHVALGVSATCVTQRATARVRCWYPRGDGQPRALPNAIFELAPPPP